MIRRSGSGAVRLGLLVIVVALIVVIGLVANRREGDGPGGGNVSLGRSGDSADQVTDAAQRSLAAYWTSELPKVYNRRFVQLAGGFQPKTPQSPAFSCDGQQQSYEDLRGNTFYCGGPDDDYIAWDAAELFPRLTKQFGDIAPAVVLAHEAGHAVQARVGVEAASVVRELQADCFAGSWTRFAETSDSDPVSLTDGALDSAVVAILTLRDQPGTAAGAQQAHGLGFDRVNAFQTGYEQGARRCAEFPQQGVVTTELPFRTVAESETGGNLPYGETVQLLSRDLTEFWTAAVPKLKPGKTFSPPTDVPSDQELQPAHEQIGDLATGTLLSDAWAKAAQTELGLPTTGKDPGIQRDCFTGAWIAHLAGTNLPASQLSPGDLDEAVTEIVTSSFAKDGRRMDRGGAFERTKALRNGVFNNISACV